MLQLFPEDIGQRHDDHVRLSFADTSGWADLPYPASSGGHIALMLFGDAVDGPFAVLGSTTPTDMDAPRGPAHGHESDSWRISLIGSSPMGNESYGPGEFRWQDGGRPYGADGYASGPTGGHHLVMFGDRRGFATQPVKKDLVEHFQHRDRAVAAQFGIDIPDEYPPEARGVRTSIGRADKAGKVNGSFADAATWHPVSTGVRASWGVMGHEAVGPVVLSARADADAQLLPTMTLRTEVVVMVVAGTLEIGGCTYGPGELRITAAGAPTPAIVAGTGGADVCVIVADRSALTEDELVLGPMLLILHEAGAPTR